MSNPPAPVAANAVTAIKWNELFPGLILVRATRVALMLRVILLAVVGVIATEWGWTLIEDALWEPPAPTLVRLTERPAPTLFGASPAADVDEETETTRPIDAAGERTAPSPSFLEMAERASRTDLFEAVDGYQLAGPLLRGWAWAAQPMARLYEARGWRQWLALNLAGFWGIAVWALFGGAISRIAALYLTRGETLGPIAALKAAALRWPSTAGAPALVYLAIILLALPLVFAGFLARASWLAFLLGLVWIVAVLAGLALALVAIGLLIGWPLMWATVAVERTDAFDAISRAYAYSFQRPLRAILYVLVACVLGLLAQTVVSVVVDASLAASARAVDAGAGDAQTKALLETPRKPADVEALGALGRAGGKMMRFWDTLATWIAASFPMAYLWPAATGIYLLLRRLVDCTDLGESALDEGPPTRGAPPLVANAATGIPQVKPDGEVQHAAEGTV